MSDRRILILGSASHSKLVTAYEWHKLPQKLNVSDFDTLILDFSRFQDREYARSIDIKLLPSWRQFARHVFSTDSEVIAIGSPRFSLGTNPFVESTWWLPLELECVYETGKISGRSTRNFRFILLTYGVGSFTLSVSLIKQAISVTNIWQ